MRSTLRRVASLPALAALCCLALLASACGGDSSPDGDKITAGTAVVETTAAADTTTDADTTPATIMVADAYTAEDVPQWEDGSAETANAFDGGFDVEVLGMAMTGQGEFVRLTPTTADGADADGSDIEDQSVECSSGWLGFRFEDGEIYQYEELGVVGYARLFNGPRGQDAIVVSCEESAERVLVQGSAVAPETGIPELTDFTLGQPHLMDFDADFGWRGDLFAGYGWHGGWDELIFFDTATGFVAEANQLLGTRMERLSSGFDFVLPNGWELRQANPGDGAVEMWASDQSAWISILPVESAGDPEFPEDTEPEDFLADTAGLWEYVSADRAKLVGSQDRLTWTVNTNDGTLRVMHLEAGAVDLIVEVFVDDSLASSATSAVVNAAIEQIRSYQAVG